MYYKKNIINNIIFHYKRMVIYLVKIECNINMYYFIELKFIY